MSAVKKRKPAPSKVDNLVFGLGLTGMSVARYLKRNGIEAVFVDSRREPPALDELHDLLPDVEVVLGDSAAVGLKNINRVIASPGVADAEPLLAAARECGIDIVSDIELFAQEARAAIVAVTGSNGKSTVTTLLALMCDAGGKTALAGANLGELREGTTVNILLTPEYQVLRSTILHTLTPYPEARIAIAMALTNESPAAE